MGIKGKEGPRLKKYGRKRKREGEGDDNQNEDDDKYNDLLNSDLTPKIQPIAFANNLEVMADPVYIPDNYIFVKQFNDEMNKIMDKLGKYEGDQEEEQEPSQEEEPIEVTENYLSHFNSLFNKTVPFLHDLNKVLVNSANS